MSWVVPPVTMAGNTSERPFGSGLSHGGIWRSRSGVGDGGAVVVVDMVVVVVVTVVVVVVVVEVVEVVVVVPLWMCW